MSSEQLQLGKYSTWLMRALEGLRGGELRLQKVHGQPNMLWDGSRRAKATAHTEETGRRGQRSCREQYLGQPSSETLASLLPRIPMKNNHTLLLCPRNHKHVMLPCPLLKRKVISHPTQIFWDGTYAPVCIPALSTREGGRAALLSVWLLTGAAICRNWLQVFHVLTASRISSSICCRD